MPRSSSPTSHRLLAVALAVLVVGCVPTSDGGEVRTVTDPRIPEILAAREALAAAVPAVVAAAEDLAGAHGDVLTLPGSAARRAEVAAEVSVDALVTAGQDLATVELVGEGPDVLAARDAVLAAVGAAGRVAAAVPTELGELTALAAFDVELAAVAERFDEPGSRRVQVALFDELAAQAAALAARAEGEAAALPCVGAWVRRAEAASTLAARAEEAEGHVAARRGLDFDALRDAVRADPYGLGEELGVLDATAASCWPQDSAVPAALDDLEAAVAALTAALDPPDLR